MFSVNDLEKMTADAIRELCKQHNIVGRHKMNKAVMIENLVALEKEKNKQVYIKKTKTGDIIAFKVGEKVLSGMVKELHTTGFKVQTKNGRFFTIGFENTVWVKTNGRWPKWVYLALKGEQNVVAKEQA